MVLLRDLRATHPLLCKNCSETAISIACDWRGPTINLEVGLLLTKNRALRALQTHTHVYIYICGRVKSWSRICLFIGQKLVQVFCNGCFWKCHFHVKNWSNYVVQLLGPIFDLCLGQLQTFKFWRFSVIFGCFDFCWNPDLAFSAQICICAAHSQKIGRRLVKTTALTEKTFGVFFSTFLVFNRFGDFSRVRFLIFWKEWRTKRKQKKTKEKETSKTDNKIQTRYQSSLVF